MQQLLTQFALSAVTAVLASYVTVWLALRRFTHEKWWERKLAAYTSLMEDLHHMKRNLTFSFEAEIAGREVSEPLKSELAEAHKAAMADLMRHADLGEFILSTEAASELERFGHEIERVHRITEGSYTGFLDDSLGVVSECLKRLKPIAKADLDAAAGRWIGFNVGRKGGPTKSAR